MLFPKRKRIRDRALLAEVRGSPCCVAGCRRRSDPAHIIPVSRGGDDVPENIMPLCRIHHIEQHSIGWQRFREQHPEVRSWAEIRQMFIGAIIPPMSGTGDLMQIVLVLLALAAAAGGLWILESFWRGRER